MDIKSWDVTARAINRHTGREEGEERTENVDTDNDLFKHCKNCQDVHEAYEVFWNDMNKQSETIVLVTNVQVR